MLLLHIVGWKIIGTILVLTNEANLASPHKGVEGCNDHSAREVNNIIANISSLSLMY